MKLLKVAYKSLADFFFRDDGLVLAGSISYFFMMSFIPFCILLCSIFGYFLGHDEAFFSFISERLMNLFPDITSETTQKIRDVIAYRELSFVTVVIYALLSFQLFSSLETSVNFVSKSERKRPFFLSLLLSLLIITLLCIFIVLSFGASTAISMLKTLNPYLPGLKTGKITGFLISFALPFALLFLNVTALYFFLPRKKAKLDSVIKGALFTAIFLETAKQLFTIYVINVAQLGTIYGSLSAVVIFLLWVYYSSCIFLIGAEIVYHLEAYRNRAAI